MIYYKKIEIIKIFITEINTILIQYKQSNILIK